MVSYDFKISNNICFNVCLWLRFLGSKQGRILKLNQKFGSFPPTHFVFKNIQLIFQTCFIDFQCASKLLRQFLLWALKWLKTPLETTVLMPNTYCFYLHESVLPFSDLPHLFSYGEGRGWEPECTNRFNKQTHEQGEKICGKVKVLKYLCVKKFSKKCRFKLA